MKTAKFNGIIYEVKPTGKKSHTPAKSFYDINGYFTERKSETNYQMGLYENGILVFTLGKDGSSIFRCDKKFGNVSVRDTDTDPFAHALLTALNQPKV